MGSLQLTQVLPDPALLNDFFDTYDSFRAFSVTGVETSQVRKAVSLPCEPD